MRQSYINTLVAGIAMLLVAVGSSAQADGPAEKAIGVAPGSEPIKAIDHIGERRYALVIGVNDYADKNIPDLTTAEADAKALFAVLTDPEAGGIDKKNATLLVGEDATTRNIKRHLADLRKVPVESTVFIYFSGHGAKEADEAFWVSQDAEIDALAASGVADRDVRAFLERIPSQRVIVMIDACYAAATVSGAKTLANDFSPVLSKFTGKGRAYLMAAGSGEEAIEASDLKRSVFTHYLVEGLAGKADANTDGVIALPELTAYIDKHVAEEARQRGGIQKPVVKMEDVQEPSKFKLTIDADRLRQNLRETAATKALRVKRLAKLESLYLEEKLTRDQTQQGLCILNTDPAKLDPFDAKRLGYYQQVADGSLDASKLQRALDLIETPDQRKARLAREAAIKAEAEKQAKIAELLTKAKSNDSKEHGKAALAALDELLKLAPDHAEALKLRKKIADYFGPSKVGDTITNGIGMKLTYIPKGMFTMGSPRGEADRHDDETQHKVTLSQPFLMGVTEVTQGQWEALMGTSLRQQKDKAHDGATLYGEGKDYPVYYVSWDDAVEFCAKLTEQERRAGRLTKDQKYTLPTEAQWEYACRAGTTTAYHAGDSEGTLGKAGWYMGNADRKTHVVGQKQSNKWGLYDMHGNVWEWCSDWYGDYPGRSVTDPTGVPKPAEKAGRILRGGGWGVGLEDCRSASRSRYLPYFRFEVYGFRVVLIGFSSQDP
jgi:formylglycine-generating enzyme required for sulfatase activity